MFRKYLIELLNISLKYRIVMNFVVGLVFQYVNHYLMNSTVQMNSAFGGLLFLQSPEGESSSITVNLHHVVLTPTYDLTDPNRAQLWQYQRQMQQVYGLI